MIIRQMCQQFQLPVEIMAHETVREEDGLAISSRNRMLTDKERMMAPQLYQQLCLMRDRIMAGETDLQRVEHDASAMLGARSEEHTSELQSRGHLVCRLLLEKKK